MRLANEVHLRWRQTRESNPNAAPQPITTACLLKQKELESDSLTLSAEKQSSLFSAGSHLSSLASQTSHTLLSPLRSHSTSYYTPTFSFHFPSSLLLTYNKLDGMSAISTEQLALGPIGLLHTIHRFSNHPSPWVSSEVFGHATNRPYLESIARRPRGNQQILGHRERHQEKCKNRVVQS